MSFGDRTDQYGDVHRREAQYQAAVSGAGRGALAGFAVAAPTAYLLHRSWAPFRALGLPLKAFFITSATVMTGVITADKSGIAWDQAHYTDQGAAITKRYRSLEEKEWSELNSTDKALTWAKSNKFALVAGAWAVSMGGTFAYINTQPMSFAQKLVQARVWAQGATLLALVGMAGLSAIPSAGDKILDRQMHASDHSWKDFIGDTESDPSARKAAQQQGQKSTNENNKSNAEKNKSDRK